MANSTARSQRFVERLRVVTSELSGIEAAEIDEARTFLELGFDSLFLTQLAAAFQAEYGLKITFRQLFDELPTLEAIAGYVDAKLPPDTAEPAPPPSATAPIAAISGESVKPALVPAADAPAATATSFAALGEAFSFPAGAGASSGLQSVMAQQLALMSQQLQLLRGLRGGAAPSPLAKAMEAALAVVPAPATPAVAKLHTEPAFAVAPVPSAVTRACAADAPKAEAPAEKSALPKGFGPQVTREPLALTPRQRGHLDRLVARYNSKTMGSKLHVQSHRAHHADPRTAAGFNRLWKEMVYPIVIERSSGCHLWDLDGNRYIDILNGFGPNFLGHSPPFVAQALMAQIDKGIEVGPQTPLAGEAAKLFCELTGMDRVSWVNTGSEAVQAAIRLSRTYTGRNRIVVFSGDYHGNFDEVLVRVTKTASGRRTLPLAPGIPFRAVEEVLVLDYGAEESLEIIRQHAGEIAAVLVEPVQSRRPEFQPREFLHELRALTEKEGIVLVFDEVITGFRICPGGAQEHYGVKADLATYGKIIGGGMPIGVVAGRSRFMDTFDGGSWQYGDDSFPSAGVTFFAGTFVRHPLAIAAAHATLGYLKAQGPALQDGVNRRTKRFTGELNAFLEERGVKIRIPHFASQMFIRNQEESELATLLFYHLRDRGIHVLEGFPSYMTAAHTDEDVDYIIGAFKDSVHEMQADGMLPRPAAEPIGAGAWRRSFPLTEGQHEVWAASQMGDLASCAFNESDSLRIGGPLDADLFRRGVSGVLGAQEAFRARFDADGTSQWIDEDASFDVPLVDLSTLDEATRVSRLKAFFDQQALLPFDLGRGPLVRAHLVRLAPEAHLFVIYCHHIVFDGYSAEIVIREIARAYTAARNGSPVPACATVPYSVYVHRSQRRGPGAAAALDYWRGVFAEPVPPLDLPTDRPRSSVRTYAGGTIHREIEPKLSHLIRESAKSLNTSVYTLLLSSFQALVSRLSAQEDLVVGIPMAGQARLELETVGYCVNALPIRAAAASGKPFTQLVAETQRAVMDGFEHQDATLGELVRALRLPRDPSRLPLVEVIFNYSRYFSDISMPGCALGTHENRRRAVYHDMFFNIIESDGRLVVDWDYNSDLFDAATIERWIDHYCEVLKAVAGNPAQAIGDLPLMSEQQGAEVAAMWGRT